MLAVSPSLVAVRVPVRAHRSANATACAAVRAPFAAAAGSQPQLKSAGCVRASRQLPTRASHAQRELTGADVRSSVQVTRSPARRASSRLPTFGMRARAGEPRPGVSRRVLRSP